MTPRERINMTLTPGVMETLKTYEKARLSDIEARELIITNMKKDVPDLGMSTFLKMMSKEAADKIVEDVINRELKKMRLIGAFGIEEFIDATCEVLSNKYTVTLTNSIDLIERELLKKHTK